MEVGKAIRVLREQRGYSRSALAARISMSLDYLKKIETGDRKVSKHETLRLIASALDVQPETILRLAEQLAAAEPHSESFPTTETQPEDKNELRELSAVFKEKADISEVLLPSVPAPVEVPKSAGTTNVPLKHGIFIKGIVALLLLVAILPFWKLIWDVVEFYVSEPFGPEYSPNYLKDENIYNHEDGWCSAWALYTQDWEYGLKLYFSAMVPVRDFDESAHWLYYEGRWVGPNIARMHGINEEGLVVFEVSQWWKTLFPDAIEAESWRYDFQCDPPEAARNPCPQSGGVILYQHRDFDCGGEGASQGYTMRSSPGWENLPDGSLWDDASSIRIPAGWSVKLYSDTNRGGASVCRTSDDSNFEDDYFDGGSIWLNDHVQSFEVFDNSNCGSGPPPSPL